MTEQEWVESAIRYMVSQTGEWEDGNHVQYCESLYETYVDDMGDDPFSPEDAIDQDMTYWED